MVDLAKAAELAAQATALAGTVGGTAIAVWRKAVVPARTFLAEERARRARQEQMFQIMERIASEMSPNGGASLRDSIDRMEVGIQMLSQRFRVALYDSDRGVLEFDSTGALTWANRTFRDILGRDMEELKQDGWINAFPHDRREALLDEWNGCVVSGRDWEVDGLDFIARDTGMRVKACIRIVALKSPRGKNLGWTGTVVVCDNCPASSCNCPASSCTRKP